MKECLFYYNSKQIRQKLIKYDKFIKRFNNYKTVFIKAFTVTVLLRVHFSAFILKMYLD